MKRSYHSNLAFLDLLFNTLLCFVVFFALSIILMKKSNNENTTQINLDSHVMIIATWPSRYGDDVDLYVRDPQNEVVFFRNKNNAIMHLDRDDLGSSGDYMGNQQEDPENREIVTIRNKFPGTYVVNAHMYRKMHSDPVPIEIRVFKVKNGRIIINEMLILTRSGQEKTAARFRVKSDGSITVLKPLFSPIAARILGDPL
tara:strand:- start:298 stop:897 length:600 start_codon:yes stop_codon:yes gene_type:complete